jgi:hypothetical protein
MTEAILLSIFWILFAVLGLAAWAVGYYLVVGNAYRWWGGGVRFAVTAISAVFVVAVSWPLFALVIIPTWALLRWRRSRRGGAGESNPHPAQPP